MAERRTLSFASLDEVMPEVERLLAGHATTGRWSLGQICHHLAAAFRLIQEGDPGIRLEPLPEAVRRRFLRRERFPDGVEIPHPALRPPAGLDDRAGADALRAALARFAAAEDPFPPHPSLGPLTRDEWARFHCLHCGHHLGFAVPSPAAGS
jgi:hypothetical protein